MRKTLLALLGALAFVCSAEAQSSVAGNVADEIRSGPTLPASCKVGRVFFKTTATVGVQQCTAANIWAAMGGATNSAGNNVIPKSNGTNFIASSLIDDGTTLSTTDVIAVPGQAVGTKYGFTGNTTTGLGNPSTGVAGIYAGGFDVANFTAGTVALILRSDGGFGWGNTADPITGADTAFFRNGAASLGLGGGTNDSSGTLTLNTTVLKSANAATWTKGQSSELLTIAAAASTDSVGLLLPANSIIESVVVRVVTVIPTAATFSVGDATTAARFASGVAVAANTTAVGLTHVDQTGAPGPKQTSAVAVRITPNVSPGAATGQVRITVFYRSFVPPTS